MALSNLPARAETTVEATREQTIDVLRHHYAQGVLSLEAFERRVELAHQASETQALAILVADLPAIEGERSSLSGVPVALRESADRIPARGWNVAILGGCERKGRWTLPRTTRNLVACGGVTLDLRDVSLDNGVYELQLFCVMGGVEIIVPPWLRVESSVIAIAGGSSHAAGTSSPDANGPVLRISGVVLMGGCEVSERYPGESAREARKRNRALAAAQKNGKRIELPASASEG
jgi:hypothetical protein